MTFAGITNDKQRADVIAYLRTLSDNPVPLPASQRLRAAARAAAARQPRPAAAAAQPSRAGSPARRPHRAAPKPQRRARAGKPRLGDRTRCRFAAPPPRPRPTSPAR